LIIAKKIKYAKGERLNIRFNRKIKLEFHGARLTSDGDLLAYRELDEALGLFESVSTFMKDKRTGRNIQHDMTNLPRQSVYSRLAGYEDVNGAQRLPVDPVMRAVTGKKKNAAGVNTIGRFETEILTLLESRIYSFVKLIWGIFILYRVLLRGRKLEMTILACLSQNRVWNVR
jgi:hypothetical protein